jgi:hypothetical protein
MRTRLLEKRETPMHTPSLREPEDWRSKAEDEVGVAQVCGECKDPVTYLQLGEHLKMRNFLESNGQALLSQFEKAMASIRNQIAAAY